MRQWSSRSGALGRRAAASLRARPLLTTLVATTLICVAVWAVRAAFPPQPAAIPLSAALTRAGSLSVAFRDHPADATSPACGCYHDQPPGGWRGIVFPASSFTIRRDAAAAKGRGLTKYDVFAPVAGQFTDVPTFFGVEFKAVLVLVPKSVRFTGKLLNRPFSAYRARLEQGFAAAGVEDEVSLTTSAPLHVLSEGAAPIAALLPAYRARTSFSYEAATLHLRTAFSPERDPPSQYSDQDNAPAIDVLGRTKILWADVSRVRRPLTYAAFKLPVIFASSQAEAERIAASRPTAGIEMNSGAPLPDLKPPPKGYRRIAVLGFPGAFAIRIIVGAPTPGWFSQLKPGAEPGAVVVTDPLAAAARRRLRREFAAADRKPIVRLRGLWVMIYNGPHRSPTTPIKDAYKRATFSFEYPPNPPYDGINVFGAVSELKLAQAQGELTLGTQPETINAPTPLELRSIVGTGVVGKRFFVPIRLDSACAHIQVQGSADTRINGIPVTKRASFVTRALGDDRVMLFAAVGALLSGLLGLVQLRRTEPQGSSVRWPKARS